MHSVNEAETPHIIPKWYVKEKMDLQEHLWNALLFAADFW